MWMEHHFATFFTGRLFKQEGPYAHLNVLLCGAPSINKKWWRSYVLLEKDAPPNPPLPAHTCLAACKWHCAQGSAECQACLSQPFSGACWSLQKKSKHCTALDERHAEPRSMKSTRGSAFCFLLFPVQQHTTDQQAVLCECQKPAKFSPPPECLPRRRQQTEPAVFIGLRSIRAWSYIWLN